MQGENEPRNLEHLLERVQEAVKGKEAVSLREVLDMAGHRSYGPFLLAAGVATLAPVLGDIPGMPTLIATVVFLLIGQLLLGRKHLWLPAWLLDRSLSQARLLKVLGWLRPIARFIDRLLRPRLRTFTRGRASAVMAIACMLLALTMPVLEVVPFSANLAGAALTGFGLALIVQDGLLALLAFLLTSGTIGLVGYVVL